MQVTARAALEADVAGTTLAKRFAQRAAGGTGDMTGLAVADEPGVEVVTRGAWSSAIIVTIDLVALAAGRRAVAMAG